MTLPSFKVGGSLIWVSRDALDEGALEFKIRDQTFGVRSSHASDDQIFTVNAANSALARDTVVEGSVVRATTLDTEYANEVF